MQLKMQQRCCMIYTMIGRLVSWWRSSVVYIISFFFTLLLLSFFKLMNPFHFFHLMYGLHAVSIAVGIIAFAFGCQQYSFIVFSTLQNPNRRRWWCVSASGKNKRRFHCKRNKDYLIHRFFRVSRFAFRLLCL